MSGLSRTWTATRAIVRTTNRAVVATSRATANGTAHMASRLSGQHRHLHEATDLNEALREALDRIERRIVDLRRENQSLREHIAELEGKHYLDGEWPQ